MVTLWHGGAPGRAVGDYILPPTTTGVAFTRIESTMNAGVMDPIAQRRDRVYLTTELDLARVFASDWTQDGSESGYGWIYEVDVDESDLEPDEDLLSLPGVSFQCGSALVTRVWQREVKPTPGQSRVYLEGLLERHAAAKRDGQP